MSKESKKINMKNDDDDSINMKFDEWIKAVFDIEKLIGSHDPIKILQFVSHSIEILKYYAKQGSITAKGFLGKWGIK